MTTQKNELGIMCMMYGVFFLWRFISVYRDRKDPARRRLLLANGTIIAISMYLLSQCIGIGGQDGEGLKRIAFLWLPALPKAGHGIGLAASKAKCIRVFRLLPRI